MTDIDHKALADAIRADREASKASMCMDEKIELNWRRAGRWLDLESAYLHLADERQAILDRVKELEESLQWFVDNDETNEGDVPMAEYHGQTWDEINAYWIAGLNRARKLLK